MSMFGFRVADWRLSVITMPLQSSTPPSIRILPPVSTSTETKNEEAMSTMATMIGRRSFHLPSISSLLNLSEPRPFVIPTPFVRPFISPLLALSIPFISPFIRPEGISPSLALPFTRPSRGGTLGGTSLSGGATSLLWSASTFCQRLSISASIAQIL